MRSSRNKLSPDFHGVGIAGELAVAVGIVRFRIVVIGWVIGRCTSHMYDACCQVSIGNRTESIFAANDGGRETGAIVSGGFLYRTGLVGHKP